MEELKKELKNKNLCKVRTITSFLTLKKDKNQWREKIKNASIFGGELAKTFEQNSYTVQSIRIVTNAFGEYLDTSSLESAREDMQFLQDLLNSSFMPNLRIRFAIGEAKTQKEIEILPELIREFGDICNACVNVGVDEFGVPNKELTTKCAKAVKQIGEITLRGEGNFNFTINYNCKPLIPYFPASYHNSSDEDCFALGIESPDLLVEALKSLDEEENHNEKMKKSYESMSKSLQYHLSNIIDLTNSFSHEHKTKFAGIDTSAAPSKDCSSMTQVYELLGVPYFGAAGTLEASALLTRVFKSIKGCEIIGFSGLMLAVVEDRGLAQGTIDKNYDIRSLITYSSVCGIGLDTVPIVGDTSVEKIADICMDTGTMAYRLNKPLTVRLFPVPNLKEGELTAFQSDDLCNSAVLAIP